MSIPTPYEQTKERILSEGIMQISEIVGKSNEFLEYSRYVEGMKRSHQRDYLRIKLELIKGAPAWIQQMLVALNEVYNEGYRAGYVTSASDYGDKDAALKRMREWKD